MALKATIFKATLNVSDMDRHYYQTHDLVVAKHPSETTQRMMLRIIAFALNAHEDLEFTKGLSTQDEPDLWQKTPSSEIELWIELGQPDEKRIKKACSLSCNAILYCVQNRSFDEWWPQVEPSLSRFNNLSVFGIEPAILDNMADQVDRTMDLTATIQDGQLWLTLNDQNFEISPTKLLK